MRPGFATLTFGAALHCCVSVSVSVPVSVCVAISLPLSGGTTKITGLELPEGAASAKIDELPEDLKALLATKAASSKSKRKKKNKAKRAAEAAGAGAGAGAGSGAGAGAGAGAAPPS